MAFSSFARVCGMTATDEKNLSSVATFIPSMNRSSLSACAEEFHPSKSVNTIKEVNVQESILQAPEEQKLVEKLAELLGKECMLPEELGLLYSYRYWPSLEEELKTVDHSGGHFKTFLQKQKCFSFHGDHVQRVQADDQVISSFTMSLFNVDYSSDSNVDNDDDFVSATSDVETFEQEEEGITAPASVDATGACVYSVLVLLRMRAACSSKQHDADAPQVQYSTRSKSELPAPPAPKPKATTRARTTTGDSPASEVLSWRLPYGALPASAGDSWTVQQTQRKREAAGNPEDDENVLRAARSILNKLTVEKFDSLFEQLATCGISHPHHVSLLMREVFEKATTQHHFIPMYAELCSKLEKDPRIAAVVEESDQMQNFRRILLNRCQQVFEQLLESRAADAEADVDGEIVFRRKQIALGNMKLIGQLLVNGMLSSDLFTECCEELLRKRTECPEALESLVALVMVAGSKFDDKAWQYYERFQKILSDMAVLTKDKLVLPRLRFLIRDVLDARAAGWSASPSSRRATPVTLEEVRNAPTNPVQQKVSAETVSPGSKSDSCVRAKLQLKERSSPTGEASKQAKVVKFCLKENTEEPVSRPSPAAPAAPAAPPAAPAFDVVGFRRCIASIFTDLSSDKNVPAAVQKVRLQEVPAAKQAEQFADLMTRVVEERRGALRRCELAFLAGLAAAEQSAFDRKECLSGIELFFKDVYPELCNEVHRLPAIMKSEFMPTVANVFATADLNKVVPASMRK